PAGRVGACLLTPPFRRTVRLAVGEAREPPMSLVFVPNAAPAPVLARPPSAAPLRQAATSLSISSILAFSVSAFAQALPTVDPSAVLTSPAAGSAELAFNGTSVHDRPRLESVVVTATRAAT